MKILLYVCYSLLLAISISRAADSNTIVLDDIGVKNLRIETVVVEETDFEETAFALGRIDEIPENHAVVSSRISGRVMGLDFKEGETVEKGQVLVVVESRHVGDPPPSIKLMAPMGGLVVASHVRLGEPVEPDKALLDISDLTEVFAIARVPESQIAMLKPGSNAHIHVPALGEQSFEGEMIRFGSRADRESGTVDAVFKLPNPGMRMRSNMRAEFSIVLSRRENVMAVPRAALQGEPSNRFVYVRHFDLKNAFIKAPVQVGAMNDRMVEIVSGIFPADEVVTRGAYSLSFAGGGSVSLKEALDAAHGHEHAEDGGELTPEKKAEIAAVNNGGKVDADGGSGSSWMYVSGVLFILLLGSLITKKRGASDHQPNDC